MNTSDPQYYLQRTKRKYLLLRIIEILLSSFAIAFIVLSVCLLLSVLSSTALFFGISCGLMFFLFQSRRLNIFQIREKNVVAYLNAHYPQLEESADLLLRDNDTLTSIQKLQKNKSIQQIKTLYPSIKLPNHLWKALGIFLLSLTLFGCLRIFSHPAGSNQSSLEISKTTQSSQPAKIPAIVENVTVTITPPLYTGVQKLEPDNINIQIPEASTVEWAITFTRHVIDPQLIFSARDSVNMLSENSNPYNAQRTFNSSVFYQIAWKNIDGSKKYSDYFEINVIKDQPPEIVVEDLDQFVELTHSENLKINFRSALTDDYGLRDAYIIATVSKGSGEAIKFREEKLNFDKSVKIEGKSLKASRLIDLQKLGLDPGDELYFYVEAFDNKQPLSNRSRTETFFISLLDTATLTTSVDTGLGVDLMPEYFRSQRQIIIDSEKLLKAKSKIKREDFNSRSNELAYDQKVLRLRYGEFLGEEFESGIGPQAGTPAEEDHDEDVTKKYGHVHDKGNEHNLVEEKKQTRKETHVHDTESTKDPAEAYMHKHDSDEEATFFTQSIRSKLKAAITIMWDAELYLRLYAPEKSLPFQYKALKLLKEISQDSRIYVHRTGFDPPPLKEDKRLTGDLAEIQNSTNLNDSPKNKSYPYIRKATGHIEQLLLNNEAALTPEIKNDLGNAGRELSSLAMEEPGRYLKTLSSLKAITENELDSTAMRRALLEVRSSFWHVLPEETTSPQVSSQTSHVLDKHFLNNLKVLKQE